MENIQSRNNLYGLVLAGGKSTRMGQDKGKIVYHEQPQRDHIYEILDSLCEKTFLSVRDDQIEEKAANRNYIFDQNKYRGPYNGIISAHEKFPDKAWLVVATDLPLLAKSELVQLISERNATKMATAFATRENKLPEPLIAIWEPIALQKSIEFLEQGNGTCPRKFLINNDVHLVFPENDEVLLNANTLEDLKSAQAKLS